MALPADILPLIRGLLAQMNRLSYSSAIYLSRLVERVVRHPDERHLDIRSGGFPPESVHMKQDEHYGHLRMVKR